MIVENITQHRGWNIFEFVENNKTIYYVSVLVAQLVEPPGTYVHKRSVRLSSRIQEIPFSKE